MPMPPAPDWSDLPLAEVARLLGEARLPPVDDWHPARCGHSAMRIDRDGGWWHEGAPIARAEMVRLFAGLLRREADGRHVLVTPVERLDIDVESTPFVAVSMTVEGEGRGQCIGFTLTAGGAVIAGPDHPIRIEDGEPRVLVRGGLEARLARPVYYDLAERALAADPPGVWSDGAFFALGASA